MARPCKERLACGLGSEKTTLHYTVLYHTTLCCTILYTIPHRTIPYYTDYTKALYKLLCLLFYSDIFFYEFPRAFESGQGNVLVTRDERSSNIMWYFYVPNKFVIIYLR